MPPVPDLLFRTLSSTHTPLSSPLHLCHQTLLTSTAVQKAAFKPRVDASLLDFAARVEEDELGKGVQGGDMVGWFMAIDEDKNVSAYWNQWFGVLRAPA
jgi:hypothetical protein